MMEQIAHANFARAATEYAIKEKGSLQKQLNEEIQKACAEGKCHVNVSWVKYRDVKGEIESQGYTCNVVSGLLTIRW